MSQEELIAKIVAFGWTLNENRIMPLDFWRTNGNNIYRLRYYRGGRYWSMRKNDYDEMFRGQDAEPEEIIGILPDLIQAIG